MKGVAIMKISWRNVCFLMLAVGLHATAIAQWSYRTNKDEMTNKSVRTAKIKSSNFLSLGFPYQGATHGTLYVRGDDGGEADVYLYVDRGQILCNTYSGCQLSFKFDDDDPIFVEGVNSSDHDPSVVFVRDPGQVIERARTAKTIRIQFTMYQAGNPVLRFTSKKPLSWQ